MDLTYADVGATQHAVLPRGYRHLRYERVLSVPYERAVETLMTWQAHRRTGLSPRPTAPRAATGVEVVCRLGPFREPCRVVWALETPDRTGFGYGTLPGHPFTGEESFVLERVGDRVTFTITVFSRPARWYTRLSGPLPGLAQRLFVRLYGRAVNS